MILGAYQVAYLITNLFNLYVVKRFMEVFFLLKKNCVFYATAGYAFYYIVTSIVYLAFDTPLLNTVVNIFLLICVTYFYEADIKKKLWAVFFLYLVLAFVELAITILTLRSGFDWLSSLGYSNIFWLFVMKISQFAVVLLIQNIIKIKSTGEVPVPFLITSILLPIISIIMLIQVTSITNIDAWNIVVMILLLLGINTMVFFLYDSFSLLYERQLKAVEIEQERQFYYHQCQLMQKTAEDVRDFRHDINNHIMMLQELIDRDKVQDVQRYIHALSHTVQNIESIYSCTGNIVIDSIINYKLSGLVTTDLNIQVEATVPTELPVEIMDLSVILTNLLDNALCALKKTKKGELLVRINYRKGILFIMMKNSYDGYLQYENGELVTTKHEAGHGRGLKLVEKAIEKYDGLLNISHNRQFFIAEVLLYTRNNLRK